MVNTLLNLKLMQEEETLLDVFLVVLDRESLARRLDDQAVQKGELSIKRIRMVEDNNN